MVAKPSQEMVAYGGVGAESNYTKNAGWRCWCLLRSLIKLLGDECGNYLHELVYLQACLPSPAMAHSLEGH